MALCVLGCGQQSSIERIQVQGTVTVNGTPIKNGQIQFVPLGETPGPVAGAPIVDGTYLVTNKGGVPLGHHRVVIKGYQPPPPGFDPDAGAVQFLPERFNQTSELEVDISDADQQVIRDFALTFP